MLINLDDVPGALAEMVVPSGYRLGSLMTNLIVGLSRFALTSEAGKARLRVVSSD